MDNWIEVTVIRPFDRKLGIMRVPAMPRVGDYVYHDKELYQIRRVTWQMDGGRPELLVDNLPEIGSFI